MQINNKDLFNPDHTFTPAYSEFVAKVDEALLPILDEYIAQGFRLSDLEMAVIQSLNMKMSETRIHGRIHLERWDPVSEVSLEKQDANQ